MRNLHGPRHNWSGRSLEPPSCITASISAWAFIWLLLYLLSRIRRECFAPPPSICRSFQALGDTTRLRLLNLLAEQEVCVCYFVEILGGPQPKISRHLAYLRKAGIVSTRRDGKWMHYRIIMPPHAGASQVLRQTLEFLKEDKAMQADRARLKEACCSPGRYALDGVPLPTTVAEPCCELR